MNEKIVSLLIGQHNQLKEILIGAKGQTESPKPNFELIIEQHELFKKKLGEHLALENGVFYPAILAGMREKRALEEKIVSTKKFIKEMKAIEVVVAAFFNTYNSAGALQEKWRDYPKNLNAIIATLLLRIESEEDGIYLEWDFWGKKE
jgi:hypothetical protein